MIISCSVTKRTCSLISSSVKLIFNTAAFEYIKGYAIYEQLHPSWLRLAT